MIIRAGLNAAEPINLNTVVANQTAFRTWYEEALPQVYRYLLVRAGHDVALAEALTRQTFVEAIRRRSRFDSRSDAVTWLYAIGRRKLADHYRRSGRRPERDLSVATPRTDSHANLWSHLDHNARVQYALAQLSSEQRIVLILRYLDQLPVREIASTIGRSEKVSESLVSRAREAFRRAYGDTQP